MASMKSWQETASLRSEKHVMSALKQGPEILPTGLEGKGDEASKIQPGTLNLEEDAAGGLGRHLGLFSTTLLMLVHQPEWKGRIAEPDSSQSWSHRRHRHLLDAVIDHQQCRQRRSGSVALGARPCSFFRRPLCMAGAGMYVPRSGGEKVYLEAAYQRPRLLATIVFSTQAILLGFTGVLPCGPTSL